MATVLTTITKAWSSSLADGAKNVNIGAPRGCGIYYFVGTSAPAAGSIGQFLDAGAAHPVNLASGEHLYARLIDDNVSTAATLQVAVTDAP